MLTKMIQELNMIHQFTERSFDIKVERRDVQLVVSAFIEYYQSRWWRRWSPKSNPQWVARYIAKKYPNKDKDVLTKITIALQLYLATIDSM